MGWLILLVFAAAAFLLLWRLVRPGSAGLQLVGAALLFACAGYAWQGHPNLAGAPKHAAAQEGGAESAFAAMRGDMLGRFDVADTWLTMSESYARAGDTRGAADMLRSAIARHPNNATLWIGYGNALVLHAGGLMTPAAEMAYERAAKLAPGHPAPRFFYGLSLAQGGRLDDAEKVWRDLLASSAPNARWRAMVQQQIDLIERAKAIAAMQRAQAQARGQGSGERSPGQVQQ